MAGSVALGARLGSYHLDSIIGGAGSSVVYRATHVRLGSRAAVKVLAPAAGADDAARERVLRAAEQVAALDHPSVIPLYDADVQDGAVYVAMRYVAGGDLRGLLSRTGALDAAAVESVLGPAAHALDAAHAAGVVHGNLKPSNILLERDADGRLAHVYVSDFGAPPLPAGRTLHGAALDRLDHASPEQLEGASPTPRSDVYSLACIAYHCITGRVPFGASLPGAAPRASDGATPPPPSSVRRELPAALDGPILRGLAVDPEERFGSCGELMAAFAAAAGDAGAEALAAPEGDAVAPAPASRPATDAGPPPPASAEPAASSSRARDRTAGERGPSRIQRGTAVAVGLALVAAVAGYATSALVDGGDDGRGSASAPVRADAAKDGLGAVIAAGLPGLRCTVTSAPPGGAVVENARCTPDARRTPGVSRVTLARFSSTAAMNDLYRSARRLSPDSSARLPGTCRPDVPWGGSGRWAGGRMFCAGAGRASITWTVDSLRVLATASGVRRFELGTWWLRERDLRRP
ncbi:MAG TPA: serine/threonine-protein kinase [Solirubrobacteraceae bacterium]|nr:serine/threonine-protein kinase [Solirubrobacteraceae bacterium]